jgi:hypothetical protein
MLLQSGAGCQLRNGEGRSALDLAATFGRTAVVEALVTFDPELVATVGKGSMESPSGADTPLQLAAGNGHLAVVRLLLERGHPINAVSASGSALHAAATAGKASVVELLLERSIARSLLDGTGRTAVRPTLPFSDFGLNIDFSIVECPIVFWRNYRLDSA